MPPACSGSLRSVWGMTAAWSPSPTSRAFRRSAGSSTAVSASTALHSSALQRSQVYALLLGAGLNLHWFLCLQAGCTLPQHFTNHEWCLYQQLSILCCDKKPCTSVVCICNAVQLTTPAVASGGCMIAADTRGNKFKPAQGFPYSVQHYPTH